MEFTITTFHGILPSDANKIAIEFVKERGNNVIKKVCKKK